MTITLIPYSLPYQLSSLVDNIPIYLFRELRNVTDRDYHQKPPKHFNQNQKEEIKEKKIQQKTKQKRTKKQTKPVQGGPAIELSYSWHEKKEIQSHE